jgi:hypothetical protein
MTTRLALAMLACGLAAAHAAEAVTLTKLGNTPPLGEAQAEIAAISGTVAAIDVAP